MLEFFGYCWTYSTYRACTTPIGHAQYLSVTHTPYPFIVQTKKFAAYALWIYTLSGRTSFDLAGRQGSMRGRAGKHAWKKGHAWKRKISVDIDGKMAEMVCMAHLFYIYTLIFIVS